MNITSKIGWRAIDNRRLAYNVGFCKQFRARQATSASSGRWQFYVNRGEEIDAAPAKLAGSRVNLEIDLVARYVERMLSATRVADPGGATTP